MKTPNALLSIAIVAIVSTAFIVSGSAGEINADPSHHGMFGVEIGPSMNTGRTHMVDGISGATLSAKRDSWQKYAASTGVFIDLGFPTSHRGAKGTVGVRLNLGGTFPGPFFNVDAMARYRFKFDIGDDTHKSVEPWAGAGIGFHFKDQISSSIYMQLPIAVGCDFQLGVKGLYLTTTVQLNTLNPMGPTYLENNGGNPLWLRPRYDSYMLKLGIAWQFY